MRAVMGLLGVAALGLAAQAQVPVTVQNCGFDSGVVSAEGLVPAAWRMTVGNADSYEFVCDTADKFTGAASGRLRARVDAASSCCHIDQALPPSLVTHRLHVRARVKGSSVLNGNVQLVVQAANTNGGFRQLLWQSIGGGARSTEWTLNEGDATAPAGANEVWLTLYMKPNQPAGTTLWVDELEVTDLTTAVVYRLSPQARQQVQSVGAAVFTASGRRLPSRVAAGSAARGVSYQPGTVVTR